MTETQVSVILLYLSFVRFGRLPYFCTATALRNEQSAAPLSLSGRPLCRLFSLIQTCRFAAHITAAGGNITCAKYKYHCFRPRKQYHCGIAQRFRFAASALSRHISAHLGSFAILSLRSVMIEGMSMPCGHMAAQAPHPRH